MTLKHLGDRPIRCNAFQRGWLNHAHSKSQCWYGPAVTSEPLLSYIRRHLDAAGRLVSEDLPLPDEPPPSDSGLRWAPGALDGVMGHHAVPDDDGRAPRVAELLAKAFKRQTRRRLRAIENALVDASVLGIVDHVLEELIRTKADAAAVRRVGLWLAGSSPHREPVKMGLALLGIAGLDAHIDVVQTLGAHNEFTLFAATALRNGLAKPDSELRALAASVDGWGRIHCVERLRNTEDPQIRSWLLREGYRNSIMYEYTALIAAETGGLLAALGQEPVDRQLLTAAGEILSALIRGGPTEDIRNYADGADATERYLTLMQSRAESLDDYLAVAAIRDFVGADERWAVDLPGWSVGRRDAFDAVCRQILGQSHWRDRVSGMLESDTGDSDFWNARTVAHDLGIDTFEATFRQLDRNPLGFDWFDAWQNADTDRAMRLTELARTRLPLIEIASGPATELGMGPEWLPHRALGQSIEALRNHPGIGGDLLIVGLQSPVTRNRNSALKAFQQWPAESWPPEVHGLIEAAAATDPDEGTRDLAGRVLRGEPPD